MLLSDQILNANALNFELKVPLNDVKSLTNCWIENYERDPEFLSNCFPENFASALTTFGVTPTPTLLPMATLLREKRDENLMKKIVNAYSDVFGSHSKTQKK